MSTHRIKAETQKCLEQEIRVEAWGGARRDAPAQTLRRLLRRCTHALLMPHDGALRVATPLQQHRHVRVLPPPHTRCTVSVNGNGRYIGAGHGHGSRVCEHVTRLACFGAAQQPGKRRSVQSIHTYQPWGEMCVGRARQFGRCSDSLTFNGAVSDCSFRFWEDGFGVCAGREGGAARWVRARLHGAGST